jgi:hypothetical protein
MSVNKGMIDRASSSSCLSGSGPIGARAIESTSQEAIVLSVVGAAVFAHDTWGNEIRPGVRASWQMRA